MTRHVLDNANLWIGDGSEMKGHVEIADGRIVTVAPGRYAGNVPTTDLEGQNLSPGLIDLMALGGFDRSIMRDDPMDIAREYVKLGVTSCQFCSATLPWPEYVKVANNVLAASKRDDINATRVLGLYLEGPFMHPDFAGASLKQNTLPPTKENIDRVLKDAGEVLRMINISPGVEGAPAAVKQLIEAGKIVSMAHSNASVEDIAACIEAGTSVLGHVFDNNSGRIGDSGVQQPTLEQFAMVDERVRFIHMICDGSHVHPMLVKLVVRTRGTETICLITDCIPKAGCPDGEFLWDDGRMFYKKNGVGRTDKHHLCGGALLLPDMLRNFVKFTGVKPAKAIRTATLNPAAQMNMADDIGLLAPGRRADLALWTSDLKLRGVWRNGARLANVSDFAEIQ